jgi:hypothetical protein
MGSSIKVALKDWTSGCVPIDVALALSKIETPASFFEY